MRRLNIKKKDRKFKIDPKWAIKTEDGWTYYVIGGVREQKLITKPEWNFYIIFEGDIEPFELKKSQDHLQYFRSKRYLFAPDVYVSHQDKDGFIHIKTEAGFFAIKVNSSAE